MWGILIKIFGSPAMIGLAATGIVAIATGLGVWWQGTKIKWKNLGAAEVTSQVNTEKAEQAVKNATQNGRIEAADAETEAQRTIRAAENKRAAETAKQISRQSIARGAKWANDKIQ